MLLSFIYFISLIFLIKKSSVFLLVYLLCFCFVLFCFAFLVVIYGYLILLLNSLTVLPSRQSLKYADCILSRRVRPLLKKWSILCRIINFIWWWDSSSGNLGSILYPLLIPFWPEMIVPVRVLSMGQINVWNDSNWMRPCGK